MRLKVLLHNLVSLEAVQDRDINGISHDSRTVQPGNLFCAYPGTQTDGRHYITEAIQKGAAAILMEADASSKHFAKAESTPILAIAGLNLNMSEIAARFYNYPSQNMLLIGITGTNGKTSCTHFIAACLAQAGQSCGIMGGIQHGIYEPSAQGAVLISLQPSRLTTEDAIELQRLFAQFRDKGIRTIVLEVSSHGLAQGRLNGLQFTIAGFTNLTHDHLDYHLTLADYAETKKKLFAHPNLKYAIFNQDDRYGAQWAKDFSSGSLHIYHYTIHPATPVRSQPNTCQATRIQANTKGIQARVHTPWGDGMLINHNLIGIFNLSNLLFVLTVLSILEIPLSNSLYYISQLQPVTGRMEKLCRRGNQPLIIIDYAHTPDALQQALQSLVSPKGKLWCIFGCGGNRDPSKRPLMGAIAEQYADRVIVTQDNPRNEKGEAIIESILSGMQYPQTAYVIMDRAQAITQTIHSAQPEDTILIAGKGHETHQIIGGVPYPFSDHQASHL
jgi:UDP-N-acetylmuramoyl-L-alanyl-D-glutamate--2,6-diaminopimelate ligase